MAKKDAPREYPRGKWTKEAIRVLEERYLTKDTKGRLVETAEGMCYRVAQRIASVERKFSTRQQEVEKLTKEFYQLMVERLFLPNSPTLMNAGRDDQLQYSACFVLPVGDSLVGVFDAIKYAALIHKSGGGTGFSFSSLRPKGSVVHSTRGIASGPVSFMRVFDAATAEVKQGGVRRGANMGVLRVDHPDILEFIECKAKGGVTNFNISVAATEEFMQAVKKDGNYWVYDPYLKKHTKKLKAREVFEKIVQMAWQTGDPGMLFIDRINAGPANPVPSMGPIEATNPCVVGSTLIATERGLVRIEDLVKKKMEIKILTDDRVLGDRGLTLRPHNHLWDNGIKKTWRLETKSGFELLATPDHKIMTQRGWVALLELRPSEDKVLIQAGEGGFNQDRALPFKPTNDFNLPSEWSEGLGQVLGWLVGDGWVRTGDKNCRVGFSFGKEDKKILDHLRPILNRWYGKEIKPIKRGNGVWHLSYHSQFLVDFFLKLGVKPVKAGEKEAPTSLFTAPKEVVIGFLQSLFTADGTIGIQEINNTKYIRLTSKSKKLLQQVQLLLLNLGIVSRIYNRSRKSRRVFSYTSKDGQRRTYLSDGICFELHLARTSVPIFLEKIGFLKNRHRIKVNKLKKMGFYPQIFVDTIANLTPAGKEKVYDLTEQQTSSFIANGMVISNCGEQPLYSNEACNLGSINLALMVDKKSQNVDWQKLGEVTRLATRFLDDVIEANPYPLPEIDKMVKLNRRVGLGVMGWADLLFRLEIPYDSPQAVRLGWRIMELIQKKAHQESQELAKKRGPFPNFKASIYKDGLPLRNATLTTIAPTGSISIIANCSSGIEPAFALAYRHKTNDRELTFFNEYFAAAAKKYRLDKKTIEAVKSKGNLAGLKIPSKLRRVFVTAHEIDWKSHIETQAAFQKGVDNAVSKTINLPHEATVAEVRRAYLHAYKEGCLGITVYRDGCKSQQVLYAGEEEGVRVKPRPAVVTGKTYRIEAPVGTAFVTVNINGEGKPLEVFVNVGKAGSDITADAQAIGRLISLILRLGSGFPPEEVLGQIVGQLEGIAGGESVGFGRNRVRSLADGIAKVLKEHLGGKQVAVGQVSEQPGLLFNYKRRDLCPTCGRAALIYEEGCTKCLYCGYNKC